MNIPINRLRNQKLLGNGFVAPKEAVTHMGVIQAQDYSASLQAICARCHGVSIEEAEAAFSKGDILRTHVLRPTWHLVTPEDIGWMLFLSGERIRKAAASWWKNLNLTELDFQRSNRYIEEALLPGKALTRKEIQQKLLDASLDAGSHRLAQMLFRAEVDSIICSGGIQDRQQTYTLLRFRTTNLGPFEEESALAKLAHRYFSSRGPATLDDFAWFSGLTVTQARKAILLIRDTLVEEKLDSKTYYYFPSDDGEISSDTIIYLPAFDEYLISYTDRQHVLPPEHLRQVISSNGIFRPTIVRSGVVIGTWKKVGAKVVETYF